MKNKILLILFSLFAFAVPKQTQSMNAVKEVGLSACSLAKTNPYVGFLICSYFALSMNQSSYDNVFLFRQGETRALLRSNIRRAIFIDRLNKLDTNVFVIILLRLINYYMNNSFDRWDREQINRELTYNERISLGIINSLMILKNFNLLKHASNHVPTILKYVFIIMICENKIDIMRFIHNNLINQ